MAITLFLILLLTLLFFLKSLGSVLPSGKVLNSFLLSALGHLKMNFELKHLIRSVCAGSCWLLGCPNAVAFDICDLTPVSLLHYYPLLSRLSPPPLSTPWRLLHCSLTAFHHLFRIYTSDHHLPHGKQISLTLGCPGVPLYAAQVIAKAELISVWDTSIQEARAPES